MIDKCHSFNCYKKILYQMSVIKIVDICCLSKLHQNDMIQNATYLNYHKKQK